MAENTDIQTGRKHSKAPWIIIAVVALAAAGVAVHVALNQKKEFEEKTQEALKEEDVPVTAANILGHYTIELKTEDALERFTGYIDTDALGQCVLHILSEYNPRHLPLEITSDGKAVNEEIGEGTMVYKKSIDKTTITFKKDNLTCVLTK